MPSNVIYLPMTLDDFKRLTARMLDCEISVNPLPFKICDFRPAFGIIFSELIKDFDFWGYGDLDIVFGDIRTFFTRNVLSKNDALFVRHDNITSWLSIYKNSPKMNNLFRLSKDCLKILTTPEYYNFDETNFRFGEFTGYTHYSLVKSEIESMTHLVKKLSEEGLIKSYFELHAIEGTPGRIRWINGKLFYKNEFEIIAYHLKQFKQVYEGAGKGNFSGNSFSISTKNIY